VIEVIGISQFALLAFGAGRFALNSYHWAFSFLAERAFDLQTSFPPHPTDDFSLALSAF